MIRKFSIPNMLTLEEEAELQTVEAGSGHTTSYSSVAESARRSLGDGSFCQSSDEFVQPLSATTSFQPTDMLTRQQQLRRHSTGEKLAGHPRSVRAYSLTPENVKVISGYDWYRRKHSWTAAAVDPGVYEDIYQCQSEDDSDHEFGDEGLSMSEEGNHFLSPDHREYSGSMLHMMEEPTTDQKLVSAAQRGISDLVRELLHQGGQLNLDQNGTTAFHQAAQGGFADVVRILLDTGADIDMPDSGGYTALHKAAGKGHLDVLGLLLNEGCDIDTQDETYGNTPLHEAAWNGYSKSVDLLLKNKSNAFISNRAGCTALHLAAQSGHNQSGRALLYAGCSPDVKNNYGDTPLHTAARYGHAGIARILISARCSVSEQNKNGDTALHIAAAFKRRKIAKLLVEGGMNIQLTNKQGETATDIARRKEHMSVIEIIHTGQQEPTGGVKLRHNTPTCTDNTSSNRPNSSQHTDSCDNTPDINHRDQRKKSTGLVSWIRRKFAKEKNEKSMGRPAGAKRLEFDDGNLGLFSQYVKRQGFAYYRDLAGNIRQGPVGYVPNCHCDAAGKPGAEAMLQSQGHPAHPGRLLHEVDVHTNRRLQEAAADLAAQERLLAERQECLDRLRKQNGLDQKPSGEANRATDKPDSKSRPDLQSWLATQMSDSKDSSAADPFSYSIGTKQQRFGDDFDHERISRYEAMLTSEQFLPPPRLFRSRSDETLTHSEYSFHGRAFKSREAAMQELKTLKHHEEIRERRKLIRAGLHNAQLANGGEPSSAHTQHKPSTSQAHPSLSNQNHRNPTNTVDERKHKALWMSRDNLDDDNSRTDTGCESHESPTKSHPPPLRQTVNQPARPGADQPINNRSLKRAESAHVNLSGRTDRVIGRREQSKSPERKPDSKISAAMPLKSAMRQPRASEQANNQINSGVRLYRSNSLPRDSKVEFNSVNGLNALEPKRAVKTVRYDENVKSTEIAQDLPPSLSPAQADEVLLPAKREAPIGGHDEKYSESVRSPVTIPSYQTAVLSQRKPNNLELAQQRDLRDSIVCARNELLARNKPEATRPNSNKIDATPIFDKPPIGHNKPTSTVHSNGQRPPKPQRSFHDAHSNGHEGHHPQVPFAHYSNNAYERQTSQPTIVHQKSSSYGSANGHSYSTSSLPRQPRNSDSSILDYSRQSPQNNGSRHRAPLPSYDEVQSHRVPPSYPRAPPNYQQTKQASPLQRAEYQPPESRNSQATSSGTKLYYARSFQEPSHDSPLSADINNTGSCSSSNPDSGYGGNFYDTNKPSSEYNSWYQQNLQSAARKMNAQRPVHEHSQLKQQPHGYTNYNPSQGIGKVSITANGMQRQPSRTVYTNMISDV